MLRQVLSAAGEWRVSIGSEIGIGVSEAQYSETNYQMLMIVISVFVVSLKLTCHLIAHG
ncbi:hypothetical protein EMIT053CA3_90059 [Pseudomonas donghuensis]